MARTPQVWSNFVDHYRHAQLAKDAARMATTQAGRDIELARHVIAVDAMMACLERMSESQLLGQIGLMLAKSGGRQ